ncbi:MAG: PLP-dependent aminotransferase family protein [Clostridiales bacterium]|nr:PLP-dependent aminotransferase family protein [Clostridiales bacterium]
MYQLADRMRGAQGSIIRELLKLAGEPGMISFGGGAPEPASFPVEKIAQITARALREQSAAMLSYGISEGYPPLVASLKDYLSKTEQLDFAREELIILSGGQQCADLVAKLFVNEGDTVVVENPSFVGCMNAFRSYGARLRSVPLEADGVNLEALEAAFAQGGVRLFYLIPTFQNPSGLTTSQEKRLAIYELARRYQVLVFEDNPYGELRYEGDWVPSLKSRDEEGLVLYAGSFSKTLAPGMRVGYLVYPKALHPSFKVAKQGVDVHSSTLYQLVTHEFLTSHDYTRHVEALRRRYREKRDLMAREMAAHFHPGVRWHKPEGGFFIMAWLPEGMDSLPFVQEAVQRKVITVPGSAFTVDPGVPNNGIRINFSLPPRDSIVEGIRILGQLSHEVLGQAGHQALGA